MQVSSPEFLPPPENKLQSSWSFYYDKKIQRGQGTAQDYTNNVKLYGSFDSVEGFWRHYSWFKNPSEMSVGYDIFMIRGDAAPAWESFPNGGSWIVKIRKNNGQISRVWEELLFACIGELFNEIDVCGVVLSTRPKYDNLSLWMANSNPRVQTVLGEKLKSALNMDNSSEIEYKPFKEAIMDGSSYRNAEKYSFRSQGVPMLPLQPPVSVPVQPAPRKLSESAGKASP